MPRLSARREIAVAAIHEAAGFFDPRPHQAANRAISMPFGGNSLRAEEIDGNDAMGLPGEMAVESEKQFALDQLAPAFVGPTPATTDQRSPARAIRSGTLGPTGSRSVTPLSSRKRCAPAIRS